MSLTIRAAGQRDIEEIAAIERECFSMPWSSDMLKTQLSDRHIFLVAAEGEAVLGYIGLMYVLDEGYISNIAVSENARRRGIADALIEELIVRCTEKKLAFATLEVRAGNEAAIALYAKHGFTVVGCRKGYYDKPREDAKLMTRNF